ncbi:hypothetical protein H6P81_009684 [Aristolochia fimbriata]|uniref:Uncharacterized protein n=1 Tax=Aristolochia fimbriata TaxID=158543 RepID=A0AAV7EM65_ARIFI|nr:hypothetical protein H6P81_009684 [Aristolochia fimbriata]
MGPIALKNSIRLPEPEDAKPASIIPPYNSVNFFLLKTPENSPSVSYALVSTRRFPLFALSNSLGLSRLLLILKCSSTTGNLDSGPAAGASFLAISLGFFWSARDLMGYISVDPNAGSAWDFRWIGDD